MNQKPAWEAICYPERGKFSRRTTDEERQAAFFEREAENARRIAALADWVLAEGLRQAADGADEFERFMADPTQRMRPDELDVLRRAVSDQSARNVLIAAGLRSNPTPAFLEVVAQLVESNGFIYATGQHRPKTGKMEHLTDEQIEYAESRLAIRQLLLDAYREAATENAIGRRATDVAKLLFGLSDNEGKKAKDQYENTNNKDLPKLRWMLRSRKFLARGE